MKTLEQIKKQIQDLGIETDTARSELHRWAAGMNDTYKVALTLTLKQTQLCKTNKGHYFKRIDRDDCIKIAERFMQKLNREVFGKRGADKYEMTLKYLPVLEGAKTNKHLHLHFAIGGKPSYKTYRDLAIGIRDAKLQVAGLDKQYVASIADSGWMEYICKEASTHDSDNVLWQLAN